MSGVILLLVCAALAGFYSGLDDSGDRFSWRSAWQGFGWALIVFGMVYLLMVALEGRWF